MSLDRQVAGANLLPHAGYWERSEDDT